MKTTIIEVNSPDEIAGAIERVLGEINDTLIHANYAPALEEKVAPALAAAHAGYFANEAAPDGTPWEPWHFRELSAPAEHKTLHVTGALERSLTGKGANHVEVADRDSLTWGTSDPKAAKLQDGGEFPVDKPLIGRGGGFKRVGDTITLPARPHVGLNENLNREIAGLIGEAAVEILKA